MWSSIPQILLSVLFSLSSFTACIYIPWLAWFPKSKVVSWVKKPIHKGMLWNWIESNWIKLNQIESNWIELNWIELIYNFFVCWSFLLYSFSWTNYLSLSFILFLWYYYYHHRRRQHHQSTIRKTNSLFLLLQSKETIQLKFILL